MSDVSIPSAARLARPVTARAARLLAIVSSEWATLTGIVLAGLAPRIVAALTSPTAVYFPDEYIYTQLARSISHGQLAIRGAPAHFPALLEPLLAAPFWLFGDQMLAYRLTLVMNGVVISLAAIPVYLLARRLGASRWQRSLVALLTIAAPTMVWSTYVTADAIAYPLVLGAIAVGVAALERPRARAQLAFLALSGLATFARVQYVILPVAFLLAALLVERGRPLRTVRRYRVTVGVLALPIAGGAALGAHRLLGYYSSLLAFNISPSGLLHWIAVDSVLIAFATGFVLAPLAVAGLIAGFRARATTAERAFASLAVTFGALVLLETAAYATNGSPRFQERYLVGLTGLVPVAFIIGARALPRGRSLVVGIAAVLFVFLLRVPMTGYSAVSGKQDSPFLSAVFYVERLTGVGAGGLLVAGVGGALLIFAAVVTIRTQLATVALVLAGLVLAFASVGATVDAHDGAANARVTYFAGDLQWVDDTRLGPVDLLLGPGSFPPAMLEALYWNQSLSSVLNLPGSNLVDDFGHRQARIGSDGRLFAGGAPVSRPVLVDGYYSALTFQHARIVARTPSSALWRPQGAIRVSTMTVGRYFDGWLDRTAVVTVWPGREGARTGTLRFRLTFPVDKDVTAVIRIHRAGAPDRIVRIQRNRHEIIAIPLTLVRPVQVEISAPRGFLYGRRIVSVKSSVPRFVENPVRP